MPRYTFVENHSGAVWETEEGATFAEAARAMDARIGPREPCEYVEHGPHHQPPSNDTGYWVYPATDADDAPDRNGLDPAYVADVEARRCLGYVKCIEQTDDWR